VDRLIHKWKYYIDGTPKRGPNSPSIDKRVYLIQTVLDQYNEVHNLFGVCSSPYSVLESNA
jgi:hypothetical protein